MQEQQQEQQQEQLQEPPKKAPAKGKKRGPEPKPGHEKRSRRISVYVTDAEYAELLTRVETRIELAVYARHQLLAGKKAYRLVVPELNIQAYQELARAAGNLNQISKHLNGGEALAVVEVLQVLELFRQSLVRRPRT